jgi:hypothetical protein
VTGVQGELFAGPTPGTRAVLDWAHVIHPAGPRWDWAVAAAAALDAGGPGAELPPFPSHLPATRRAREAALRRVHRDARQVPTTHHQGGSHGHHPA